MSSYLFITLLFADLIKVIFAISSDSSLVGCSRVTISIVSRGPEMGCGDSHKYCPLGKLKRRTDRKANSVSWFC